jgi:hypothetical protein
VARLPSYTLAFALQLRKTTENLSQGEHTTEQRDVVRFLWAKGTAAKDIHKEMLPMYSEHCL